MTPFVLQGVNFSIAGTGGPECVAFIPNWQKVFETIFALFISFLFTYVGWKNIVLDTKPHDYGMVIVFAYVELCLLYFHVERAHAYSMHIAFAYTILI